MAKNAFISRKSKKVSFGLETVKTTITLVRMENSEYGLIYDAKYKGLKKGHSTGGPIAVSGNQTATVNEDPVVKVAISDWSEDKDISMRVKIMVEFLGSHTLFDEILEGPIPADDHLDKAMASLTDGIKAGPEEVSA